MRTSRASLTDRRSRAGAPLSSRHGRDGESSPAGRPVASVARALALLDELGAAPDGLGVNELARRIGVNASTASRLLATLQAGRMVERAPGGPYRLGLRLVALADGVLARFDVRGLARPRLRALVVATGETATLSVQGAAEAVTVDFVAAESSVMSERVGRRSRRDATGREGRCWCSGAPRAPRSSRVHRPHDRDARALAAESSGCARRAGPRLRRARARPQRPGRRRLRPPRRARRRAGARGPAARLTEARRAEVLPALLDAAASCSARSAARRRRRGPERAAASRGNDHERLEDRQARGVVLPRLCNPHCTPTTNSNAGSSIASTIPSSAQRPPRRRGRAWSTAWWWKESTQPRTRRAPREARAARDRDRVRGMGRHRAVAQRRGAHALPALQVAARVRPRDGVLARSR